MSTETVYEVIDDHSVILRRIDFRRYDAICQLLAKPDASDLPRRATREPLAGDAQRFRTWLPRIMRATRERMIASRDWWDVEE